MTRASNRRAMALSCLSAALAWPGLVSAQGIVDPQAGQKLHPVWGGQNQSIHISEVASGQRLVVGTGGGGIRVQHPDYNLGEWFYPVTPDEFGGTVIDVEFLNDDVGFAAGRGGQMLRTMDGGATWQEFGDPILDECDDLATIWSIHPFTENIVIAVGLWTAVYTANGQTWLPLTMRKPDVIGNPGKYDGDIIPTKMFHFYSVAVSGDLSDYRGAIAAEWEETYLDENDEEVTKHHGVVLHTDKNESGSNFGRVWRVVLDDDPVVGPAFPGVPAGDDGTGPDDAVMLEPWEVTLAPSNSPDDAVGYVVGGRGANEPGRVYSTDDGGETWVHEIDGDDQVTAITFATPYGVAAEEDFALVGAYSGQYLVKTGGVWSWHQLAGAPDTGIPVPALASPDKITVAISKVDSMETATGQKTFALCGGWGLSLAGPTNAMGDVDWSEVSPYYDGNYANSDYLEEFRLYGMDALASPAGTAFAGGQGGYLLRTLDHGDTWARVATTNMNKRIVSIDFRGDDLNGISVGDGGNILYTLNGGVDWFEPVAVNGSTGSLQLRDVSLVDDKDAWVVGWDSVANRSALMYSRSHGQLWVRLDPLIDPMNPASFVFEDIRLESVYFPERFRGIAVGWSDATGEDVAHAFLIDATVNPMIVTPVDPPHPTISCPVDPRSRKLLAVDGVGTSISQATIYAVGNGGMVLKWNGASFDDVPAVYDIDANGCVLSRELATDLSAVSLSPSGARILIGAQYDINLDNAADHGFMLEFDGLWQRVRSMTGKNVQQISLVSDTEGFVLGQTLNDPTSGEGGRGEDCDFDPDVETDNFDNPNLADAVILRFLDQN